MSIGNKILPLNPGEPAPGSIHTGILTASKYEVIDVLGMLPSYIINEEGDGKTIGWLFKDENHSTAIIWCQETNKVCSDDDTIVMYTAGDHLLFKVLFGRKYKKVRHLM